MHGTRPSPYEGRHRYDRRRLLQHNVKMSASTSPIKEESKDWVKFDEADGAEPSASVDSVTSPSKHKSSRSSSGVSSARGSVNSAVIHEEESGGGGVLPVSEVQVVDEETLRKKATEAVTSEPPSVFRQMQTTTRINHNNTSSNASMDNMDNVNLSDDGQSPIHIRGRQFRECNFFFIMTSCALNRNL